MGRWHAIGSTYPQQPIRSSTKLGKTEQKAQVQAQAQPVPGYPVTYRRPAHKETSTRSCQQEAVFAGQGLTASNRQLRNKDTQPQKAVAFQDQLPRQRYPLSMLHREPAPHPKDTCGHQAAPWPRATLTTPKGTRCRNVFPTLSTGNVSSISSETDLGGTSYPEIIPCQESIFL